MAAAKLSNLGRKKKKYLKLPVHVVENHNEILPYIHRAIGAGYLPFENVAMVHLDSHPDMLIAHEMHAQDSFDKEKLYSETSIENWLMPLVFAGHIDRLAWIKPPWADQMTEGLQKFAIGRSKENDYLRVNCSESYFLSELLWASEEDLLDAKSLYFNVKTINYNTNSSSNSVANLNESGESGVPCKKPKTDSRDDSDIVESEDLLPNLEENSFILDIDLDFFSTMNPFKTMYSEEQYAVMKKLYAFEVPASKKLQDIKECVSNREKQLGALKRAFSAIGSKEEPDTREIDAKLFNQLVESLTKNPPDAGAGTSEEDNKGIDWKWVHEAGCTCDDTELPHHVSNSNTIAKLMINVKKMLEKLPKPTVVTISRSSEDDYCPKDQVDDIQTQVVQMLTDLFGELDIKKHYMEDEVN